MELADRYGFSLPDTYSLNSIDDIIAMSDGLDNNAEGYVVEYEDGSRWKK